MSGIIYWPYDKHEDKWDGRSEVIWTQPHPVWSMQHCFQRFIDTFAATSLLLEMVLETIKTDKPMSFPLPWLTLEATRVAIRECVLSQRSPEEIEQSEMKLLPALTHSGERIEHRHAVLGWQGAHLQQFGVASFVYGDSEPILLPAPAVSPLDPEPAFARLPQEGENRREYPPLTVGERRENRAAFEDAYRKRSITPYAERRNKKLSPEEKTQLDADMDAERARRQAPEPGKIDRWLTGKPS